MAGLPYKLPVWLDSDPSDGRTISQIEPLTLKEEEFELKWRGRHVVCWARLDEVKNTDTLLTDGMFYGVVVRARTLDSAEDGGISKGVHAVEPSGSSDLFDYRVHIAIKGILWARDINGVILTRLGKYARSRDIPEWEAKVDKKYRPANRRLVGDQEAGDSIYHWSDLFFSNIAKSDDESGSRPSESKHYLRSVPPDQVLPCANRSSMASYLNLCYGDVIAKDAGSDARVGAELDLIGELQHEVERLFDYGLGSKVFYKDEAEGSSKTGVYDVVKEVHPRLQGTDDDPEYYLAREEREKTGPRPCFKAKKECIVNVTSESWKMGHHKSGFEGHSDFTDIMDEQKPFVFNYRKRLIKNISSTSKRRLGNILVAMSWLSLFSTFVGAMPWGGLFDLLSLPKDKNFVVWTVLIQIVVTVFFGWLLMVLMEFSIRALKPFKNHRSQEGKNDTVWGRTLGSDRLILRWADFVPCRCGGEFIRMERVLRLHAPAIVIVALYANYVAGVREPVDAFFNYLEAKGGRGSDGGREETMHSEVSRTLGVYALVLLLVFLVHMLAVMAALVVHALSLVISPQIEVGQGDLILGGKQQGNMRRDAPLPDRRDNLCSPCIIMRGAWRKFVRLMSPLLCGCPQSLPTRLNVGSATTLDIFRDEWVCAVGYTFCCFRCIGRGAHFVTRKFHLAILMTLWYTMRFSLVIWFLWVCFSRVPDVGQCPKHSFRQAFMSVAIFMFFPMIFVAQRPFYRPYFFATKREIIFEHEAEPNNLFDDTPSVASNPDEAVTFIKTCCKLLTSGATTCCNPKNLRKCVTNFCYIHQLFLGAYIGLTIGLLAVPTQKVDSKFRGGCLLHLEDMLYAGGFAVVTSGLCFVAFVFRVEPVVVLLNGKWLKRLKKRFFTVGKQKHISYESVLQVVVKQNAMQRALSYHMKHDSGQDNEEVQLKRSHQVESTSIEHSYRALV
jgi:hypothetical protein